MVAITTQEPALVTAARGLVDAEMPWREVAADLVAHAGGERDALAQAAVYWVREVGRRPSDDFQAHAVLRALEAALAQTPRTNG